MSLTKEERMTLRRQHYTERVTAFYTEYAPQKLETVPTIMQQFEGKEKVLLKALEKKYGPEPNSSAAQELYPSSPETGVGENDVLRKEAVSSPLSAASSSGYLVKKAASFTNGVTNLRNGGDVASGGEVNGSSRAEHNNAGPRSRANSTASDLLDHITGKKVSTANDEEEEGSSERKPAGHRRSESGPGQYRETPPPAVSALADMINTVRDAVASASHPATPERSRSPSVRSGGLPSALDTQEGSHTPPELMDTARRNQIPTASILSSETQMRHHHQQKIQQQPKQPLLQEDDEELIRLRRKNESLQTTVEELRNEVRKMEVMQTVYEEYETEAHYWRTQHDDLMKKYVKAQKENTRLGENTRTLQQQLEEAETKMEALEVSNEKQKAELDSALASKPITYIPPLALAPRQRSVDAYPTADEGSGSNRGGLSPLGDDSGTHPYNSPTSSPGTVKLGGGGKHSFSRLEEVSLLSNSSFLSQPAGVVASSNNKQQTTSIVGQQGIPASPMRSPRFSASGSGAVMETEERAILYKLLDEATSRLRAFQDNATRSTQRSISIGIVRARFGIWREWAEAKAENTVLRTIRDKRRKAESHNGRKEDENAMADLNLAWYLLQQKKSAMGMLCLVHTESLRRSYFLKWMVVTVSRRSKKGNSQKEESQKEGEDQRGSTSHTQESMDEKARLAALLQSTLLALQQQSNSS